MEQHPLRATTTGRPALPSPAAGGCVAKDAGRPRTAQLVLAGVGHVFRQLHRFHHVERQYGAERRLSLHQRGNAASATQKRRRHGLDLRRRFRDRLVDARRLRPAHPRLRREHHLRHPAVSCRLARFPLFRKYRRPGQYGHV